MAEVWELIKQAIERFYEVALAWLAGLNLDPRAWDDTTRLAVLAAVLVLVVALSLRRRGGRAARRAGWPEFLVTNGSIYLLSDTSEGATASGHAAVAAPADGGTRKPARLAAPADARYQLRMTVNNLNAFPVQLLELTVQTGSGRQPVITDAAAVLPPHGAVDVAADLYDLPGERGSLALYLHSTASRPRSLRLVAPLEWEPWNQRYRVKGTDLRVEQSNVPASELYRRRRLGQLRRQRVGAAVVGVGASAVRGVTGAVRQLQERRRHAVAAALAAREARSAAAMRESPITVPLAPSRARSDDEGGTEGARSQGARSESTRSESARSESARSESGRERLTWPDRYRDAPESSNGRGPGSEQADDDPPRERPRLDFPDEF